MSRATKDEQSDIAEEYFSDQINDDNEGYSLSHESDYESQVEEMESLSEDKKDNVADAIIKAFTVKRRQALIDQEDLNDNVDYETSVKRLFKLAIGLAMILAFIGTVLCGTYLKDRLKPSMTIVKQPTILQGVPTSSSLD